MRALAMAAVLAGAIGVQGARAQDPDTLRDPHFMPLFRQIVLEADYAGRNGGTWSWDADGWIGGDFERVWLRSEGEIEGGDLAEAEAQIFYGWNVHPFWDVLVGLRQDFEPGSRSYLAAGVTGLAPQFFETDATVFLSDAGDVSLRFEQSLDVYLTQFLVAEPHVETELHAQDTPELGIGAGFAEIEAGVQLRYEITRRFAPYVEFEWSRKLGETAGLARAAGEDVEDTVLRAGLRVWF